MKKANKNLYKRVHSSNGTYHHHDIPENIILVRCQEHFHDIEVTGSNRGICLDPKYDSITNHRDIFILVIEREAKKTSEGRTKRVMVRYQMNQSGYCQDKISVLS